MYVSIGNTLLLEQTLSNYQKKKKEKEKNLEISLTKEFFMRLTRIVFALNFKAQQYSLSIILFGFFKTSKKSDCNSVSGDDINHDLDRT